MSVQLRRLPDAVVSVELTGAIDQPAAADLQQVLVHALLRGKPSRVVIDLRAATRLDPTAIGMLLAAADTADDLAVGLSVCNARSDVADQLLQSGLPGQRIRATA